MKIDELIRQADDRRREGDAEAEALYREAARRARETFDPGNEARAMLAIGALRAQAEDSQAAFEALNEAAARAMEAGDLLLEAQTHHALAAAYLDAGRSKDGHDALLEAMSLYRRVNRPEARVGLARTTRMYGEHLGVLGSADDARQALELARIMFVDLGDQEGARGVEEDLQRLAEYAR